MDDGLHLFLSSHDDVHDLFLCQARKLVEIIFESNKRLLRSQHFNDFAGHFDNHFAQIFQVLKYGIDRLVKFINDTLYGIVPLFDNMSKVFAQNSVHFVHNGASSLATKSGRKALFNLKVGDGGENTCNCHGNFHGLFRYFAEFEASVDAVVLAPLTLRDAIGLVVDVGIGKRKVLADTLF